MVPVRLFQLPKSGVQLPHAAGKPFLKKVKHEGENFSAGKKKNLEIKKPRDQNKYGGAKIVSLSFLFRKIFARWQEDDNFRGNVIYSNAKKLHQISM